MSDTLVSGSDVYVLGNANATTIRINRAISAFSRFTTSNIDALVTGRVDIEFRTPSQMQSIPGAGSAAWGFTSSGIRRCYINTSLTSEEMQYAIVHELGHMVDHDVLNASDRAALMAIMDPTASTWNQDDGTTGTTAYRHHPSECFADQFPAAYTNIAAPLHAAGGGLYYYRQIHSSDYGTYRSIVGGSTGPITSVTLTSDANISDTSINVSALTALSDGDWIEITGTNAEQRVIGSHSGSGPYTISFTGALLHFHASGTVVREVSPPSGPVDDGDGGGPGDRLSSAIGVAGRDYTLQIDAESVKATESGAQFNGTFTFTIRVDPNSADDRDFDDSFPWPDVYWTFNGHTLFGGIFTGATRRHGVAGDVYYDCRAVSYDSWLDRRAQPHWFTTGDRTVFGTPITTDGNIINALVAFAVPWIDTSAVVTTNTSMPLLELQDGTVRAHISRIAEQATTALDSTPRRAYVDFDEVLHYYKGSEGTTAPYSISDTPGSGVLIPDYIEFDTDFNDSGAAVYVNGTGIAGSGELLDNGSPYVANTIIDRPEVDDSDKLAAAINGFLSRDFAPKYMIRFTVEGFHGWRAGQTVTIADSGLGVNADYEIRSIAVTPSPAGNNQIAYDISAGAAPWRGLLDIQRKDVIRHSL